MDTVFIPDTNILLELLKGEAGFNFAGKSDDYIKNKLSSLLSGKYHVVIPMHSFLETAYQFFQIRINLDNYPEWYRRRKIVFNQRLVYPIMTNANIILLREIPGQYYAANRIMEPIHEVYRNKIRKHSEAKNAYYERSSIPRRSDPRDPKFLDGMDAAILEEAIYVAQSHPKDSCLLLTSDATLNFAVAHLAEAYGKNASFAPNNLRAAHPSTFPSGKKKHGKKKANNHSQA